MSRRAKSVKLVAALLLFAFPTGLVRPVLNLLGHRIRGGARVGFSFVWCDWILLDRGARVGHLNLLLARRVLMRERSRVGRANIIKGPIDLVLSPTADLGNSNRVLRGGAGVTSGPAQLCLGRLAKITAHHRIDCTQTVSIGDFSTVAGAGSQIWTHGYVHDIKGPGRYRIDGRVHIESNVYIGSACLISMGVRIRTGVIVGGGTAVSKSLAEPGLYVSAPVRSLPRPADPQERSDVVRSADPTLVEPVFLKRRP